MPNGSSEFVGLVIDIEGEKAVERAVKRIEDRIDRIKRKAEEARRAQVGFAASGRRQIGAFVGTQAFTFGAGLFLSSFIEDAGASRAAGYITRIGQGAATGAGFGLAGATIGAGIQTALIGLEVLFGLFNSTKKDFDKLRKEREESERVMREQILAFTEKIEGIEEAGRQQREELRKKLEKESTSRFYDAARLLRARAN